MREQREREKEREGRREKGQTLKEKAGLQLQDHEHTTGRIEEELSEKMRRPSSFRRREGESWRRLTAWRLATWPPC